MGPFDVVAALSVSVGCPSFSWEQVHPTPMVRQWLITRSCLVSLADIADLAASADEVQTG
ncbi:hypothetical protein [Streptomyces sp. NPDC046832]|uniref:hypothetical protein n=1 Tax=Streptomyces sp. NPDC046832 TaxID=3155020 RepID=UPI00340F0408